MNFRIENIEVSGETYAINIPEDEIYVAAVEDLVQFQKIKQYHLHKVIHNVSSKY